MTRPGEQATTTETGGRHRIEDQRAHLMGCETCWLAWARVKTLLYRQMDERDYYADAGIPFPTRSQEAA